MNRSVKLWPHQALRRCDALLPVVAAATLGAVLTLAFRDAHALAAVIGAILGGTMVGGWLSRPSARSRATASPDWRDRRVHDLETELAAERALNAAFKQRVEEREEETKRMLGDLEMNRSIIEQQACQSVDLAEELAEQKMEIERSKQRSDYLANHDLLTGLPNRRAFQESLKARVEQAAAGGQTVGLLFIDLDKFKEVNDTLGHEAGDDLLKTVASKLGEAMRDRDFGARLGGDEFAAIVEVPNAQGRETVCKIAERLRLSLQIPIPSPKGEIAVGATIGVALYPHDAGGAAELLNAADQVMYAGKRRGRNRVVTADGLTPDELKAAVAR
jgi:diguanylate cyclase (GGDEF)-like protein